MANMFIVKCAFTFERKNLYINQENLAYNRVFSIFKSLKIDIVNFAKLQHQLLLLRKYLQMRHDIIK